MYFYYIYIGLRITNLRIFTFKVTAHDHDASSPNNEVVYRIQSGAGDKFIIDAASGIISVANGASLDPDLTEPRIQHYTLTVVALDGGIGAQQLTSSVQVEIHIKDVNNKPPVLVDPGTIRVTENIQVRIQIFIMRYFMLCLKKKTNAQIFTCL